MKTTIDTPDEDRHGQHPQNENDGTELTVPSAEGHPVDENEAQSAVNTSNSDGNVTTKMGDIFDDLEALGRPLEEVIPSEKILTSLPVRKPGKTEWVRLHSKISTRAYLYEARDEGSTYLVTPEAVEPLRDVVRYVQLSLAVNYGGAPFVWPVPIPTERKAHRAHITAFAAAERAQREWIRTTWNGNEYEVFRRTSAKVDPVWPEEVCTAAEMLRFASKAGAFEVIDSVDHPVVQALLGRD